MTAAGAFCHGRIAYPRCVTTRGSHPGPKPTPMISGRFGRLTSPFQNCLAGLPGAPMLRTINRGRGACSGMDVATRGNSSRSALARGRLSCAACRPGVRLRRTLKRPLHCEVPGPGCAGSNEARDILEAHLHRCARRCVVARCSMAGRVATIHAGMVARRKQGRCCFCWRLSFLWGRVLVRHVEQTSGTAPTLGAHTHTHTT